MGMRVAVASYGIDDDENGESTAVVELGWRRICEGFIGRNGSSLGAILSFWWMQQAGGGCRLVAVM